MMKNFDHCDLIIYSREFIGYTEINLKKNLKKINIDFDVFIAKIINKFCQLCPVDAHIIDCGAILQTFTHSVKYWRLKIVLNEVNQSKIWLPWGLFCYKLTAKRKIFSWICCEYNAKYPSRQLSCCIFLLEHGSLFVKWINWTTPQVVEIFISLVLEKSSLRCFWH